MMVIKTKDVLLLKCEKDGLQKDTNHSAVLRMLYEYTKEEYFDEINRKKRNDQKSLHIATLLAAILGVVLSAPLLGSSKQVFESGVTMGLYFATIASCLVGLVCILFSMSMKKTLARPEPREVINSFAEKYDEQELMRFLVVRTRDVVERFTEDNIKKVKWVNAALFSLAVGTILLSVMYVIVIWRATRG